MTEKEVWDWFSKNKNKLEDFLNSNLTDYTVYNQFSETISNYNELLFPEITGDESGKFVLIITCDGLREGIPYVEKLCDAAPKYDNWIVERFRRPGHTSEVNFDGLELKENDIKIKYQARRGVYDVTILIANYNPNDDRYKSLAFLYLDHFIGEYNVMTKIGEINFDLLKQSKDCVSLSELQKVINTSLN